MLALLLPAWACSFRHENASADTGSGTLPAEPTDLTSTADDELYVSSAQAGLLFRRVGTAFERLPGIWHRPHGLATLSDGRVCVSHYTSEDPLTRRSAVSCGDGRTWSREAVDLGSGVNGLAATPEGLWAIGWRDTDIEQRDGVLSLIADGNVTARIDIASYVPQFAAPLPTGGLLVTAWREDASGFLGGTVLHVSDNGEAEEFTTTLQQPAGIAVVEQRILVADVQAGALVVFDADGVELARISGLEGPLGLTSTAAGDVCVAEAQRNRIVCLDNTDILGGQP